MSTNPRELGALRLGALRPRPGPRDLRWEDVPEGPDGFAAHAVIEGQLVIPSRLRQPLGLQPGDRLALTLEADGLRLVPQDCERTRSARALIGCAGSAGPSLSLEQMDPALDAEP